MSGDELREAIARDLAPRHWPILLERHRDRLRGRADEILALPTVAARVVPRNDATDHDDARHTRHGRVRQP